MMASCCESTTDRNTPPWLRTILEFFKWTVPSAMLVMLPKCPARLAAHVTLWTGLGMSFTTATWLRWAVLFIAVASLLFLALRRLNLLFSKSSSDVILSEAKDLSGSRAYRSEDPSLALRMTGYR